ncbi:MAG: SDR family NAD(P)-dependent oxidoreductase [Chloroflexi bacterium]|nr:SDR family NAD(P)-dependent oxidoreductase [Chloroflexota bacterium]
MDALIWGASGGIGSALVTALKQENWRVFAAGRNQQHIPSEADYRLRFDADDIHTLREVSYTVATESGGIDLMVYAAGSLRSGMLQEFSLADWLLVMSGNVTGAFLAASHSLGVMQPHGHMMFIGAYVEHLILPKMGAYAVAKAAIEPLVAVLRKENRKMRFTIVRPGAVDTDLWNNAPFRKPANAKTPQSVALAILNHHQSGEAGDLNL